MVHEMAQGLLLRCVAEDEVLEDGEVVGAGQHLAMRILAVAACATDLLLVVFEGLREVEVKDGANIRFVDSHAEGNRGHNDIAPALHEVILRGGAHIVCKAGVVGPRADARALQATCHALRRMLQGHIDNGREWFLLDESIDEQVQALVRSNRGDVQVQIGSVERCLHMVSLGDAEGFADFLRHGRRCCGRERQNTRDAEFFRESGEAQILGSEIVSPLRNAMGLIDGKHANIRPLDLGDESLAHEALGGDIEEFEFS